MSQIVTAIGVIANAYGAFMELVLLAEAFRTGPKTDAIAFLFFLGATIIGLAAALRIGGHRTRASTILIATSLICGVISLGLGLWGVHDFNLVNLLHPLFSIQILNCLIALYAFA